MIQITMKLTQELLTLLQSPKTKVIAYATDTDILVLLVFAFALVKPKPPDRCESAQIVTYECNPL